MELPDNVFESYMSGDRKDFNVTMKSLYTRFPDVFKKGKKRGIELTSEDKREEAKKILLDYYLPFKIDKGEISVYEVKNNVYITQAGEVKEYKQKVIYTKHSSEKFKALDDSLEVQVLLKNKHISSDEKIDIIRQSFPQFSRKQIYGYLYRNRN